MPSPSLPKCCIGWKSKETSYTGHNRPLRHTPHASGREARAAAELILSHRKSCCHEKNLLMLEESPASITGIIVIASPGSNAASDNFNVHAFVQVMRSAFLS